MVKIEAEFNPPSKKSLWLIEITGVNEKKFCGKKGTILAKYKNSESANYDDSYWRVYHEVGRRRFTLCSIGGVKDEEANFTYRKIKQMSITPDEMSYQLTFGWGNEIYGETLEKLEKAVKEKIESCKRHIEKAKKSKIALEKLSKELHKEVSADSSQP